MLIREATINDVFVIHKLAHDIWWPTYRDILSHSQIDFMLGDMYSEEALTRQMNEGTEFLITEQGGQPTGFAGYSLVDHECMIFKLHKLYLLPSGQGKGTGKILVEHIMLSARARGGKILELNVNRSNPALSFYKKLGFIIHQEVDIPYHQYVLNDFVMRKAI